MEDLEQGAPIPAAVANASAPSLDSRPKAVRWLAWAVGGLFVFLVGRAIWMALIADGQEQIFVALGRQQLKTCGTALQEFRADLGRYPTTGEGLRVLCVSPTDSMDASKWAGPYAPTCDVRDGWRRPLHYFSDGLTFRLWSDGPNGVDESGGGDDIANFPAATK